MKRWITKAMVCVEDLLSFWEPCSLFVLAKDADMTGLPSKPSMLCLRGSPNRQHHLFPVTIPSR